MNIYHVSRPDEADYDEYSDFVVAAEDEETARTTDPGDFYVWIDEAWHFRYAESPRANNSSWIHPSKCIVRLIGTAVESVEAGVICRSFHAG